MRNFSRIWLSVKKIQQINETHKKVPLLPWLLDLASVWLLLKNLNYKLTDTQNKTKQNKTKKLFEPTRKNTLHRVFARPKAGAGLVSEEPLEGLVVSEQTIQVYGTWRHYHQHHHHHLYQHHHHYHHCNHHHIWD